MTNNTVEDIAITHGRKMYEMGKEHGREEKETIMEQFAKLQKSVDRLTALMEENSTDIRDLLHNRTLK